MMIQNLLQELLKIQYSGTAILVTDHNVKNLFDITDRNYVLGEHTVIAEGTAREILKLKDELYQIISRHSGQTFEKVTENSDRDYWMKADKAKEYGMIDEVLERNSNVGK